MEIVLSVCAVRDCRLLKLPETMCNIINVRTDEVMISHPQVLSEGKDDQEGQSSNHG